MLLTTCLLFTAMHKVWRWSMGVSVLVAGFFLIVDLGFFGANLLKIVDGGWLPLTLGAIIFFIMLTWRFGIDRVRANWAHQSEAPKRFVADLQAGKIPRVPGTAIFLTRSDQKVSSMVMDHVKHMGALHRSVIELTVLFEVTPRVAAAERCKVEPIADGVWRVTIRFGFVEIPDLAAALKAVKGLDPSIDLDHAIYFATRDLVVAKPKDSMLAHARLSLFAFLYRNAVKVVDRFNLPPESVVEVARQIEI
jgi:KUP system potassium uptake protein